jgi:uncharacterized protein (DUF1499 family)
MINRRMEHKIKWVSVILAALCWFLVPLPAAAAQSFSVPNTMAIFSFSGTRPTNLGVNDGQLAACPSSPNCVSSQAPISDAEHSIAPLAYTGIAAEALAKLKSVIQSQENAKIIESTDRYLYAEFTSKLMGFVDDVEFSVDDSAKVIQVRSASRLGQSDLGVNRKRVEEIRAKLS